MIKFAAICPHPPIIIPKIGSKDDLKLVKKTTSSMDKLSEIADKCDIDCMIVISPHGLIYPDRFNISYYHKLAGDFSQFNKPDIKFEYNSDRLLAKKISDISNSEDIPVVLTNEGSEIGIMDHGVMVPMYYLSKTLGNNLKILPIYYSFLSSSDHFNFGKIISKVITSDTFKNENIGIIASGDLSHRLFDINNKDGLKFDKKIVNDLTNNNVSEILQYDTNWLESAGECGYRSIVTLLGAIDGLNYKPEILSYEGPFGVGYTVVNFKLV